MTTARLGILGGTFDPIHFGHLDAADAARTALALDDIVLIPARDQPLRTTDPYASAYHRFALAAVAVQDRPECRVSDLELLREGPSYTWDTLRQLQHAGWRPSQLFFILGTDAFAGIAAWHGYPDILDLAHFVVITRRGPDVEDVTKRSPELSERIAATSADCNRFNGRTCIFLVQADTRNVSSTIIRTRLASGQSIDEMVPASVAAYIGKHHLYRAVDSLHGENERI